MSGVLFFGKTILEPSDATGEIIPFHNMKMKNETQRNQVTLSLHS